MRVTGGHWVVSPTGETRQSAQDLMVEDAAGTLSALLKTGVRYGYAHYLREALPNAAFVAFIGTPISNYLRKNLSVDWSVGKTVRAKMRAQIKLILKRHKYPPDLEARAVELVLKQAEALSEAWIA